MGYMQNFSPDKDILSTLDEVISSISAPADIEEIEAEYLKSISRVIPAHATALYFFKPQKKKPLRITASGVDVDFIRFYEEKGREVDPLRGWITSRRILTSRSFSWVLKGGSTIRYIILLKQHQ
jgi:hypothetical protein